MKQDLKVNLRHPKYNTSYLHLYPLTIEQEAQQKAFTEQVQSII